MAKVRASGFLIIRDDPSPSFLLMRHPGRWDLPKGHVDPGESNFECALRELEEETGISVNDIEVDPSFRFKHSYTVRSNRTRNQTKKKKLVIFLAKLIRPVKIKLTEHEAYEWFDWSPPHQIQEKTIDPLLAQFAEHFYWQRDVA